MSADIDKPSSTATLADHVMTTTFVMDKETDNTFRLTAKAAEGHVAGSIYVPKASMPDGATKAEVVVTFS